MKRRLSRQQGMSVISFLLMFVGLGFVLTIALKLAPVYLENFQIQTTLNNLKSESGIADETPAQIAAKLQKRWDINGIKRIQVKDTVSVGREAGVLTIQVEYEVEQPLMGNVSALVKFDNSVEVGGSN